MTKDSQVTFDIDSQGTSRDAIELFVSGFHREAIRHEAQDLLVELHERSGRPDIDGQALIQQVLSDKDPTLALNERRTKTERNRHSSLRHLLLGVTTGIRNFYSHDVRATVSREDAAMWLLLMSRLRSQIESLEPPEDLENDESDS